MKIWVIALALAVFAGSQAFVIRSAPEGPSKLAQFFDEIEHFLEKIDNTTDHQWEQLKKSETGKIIAKWLEDEDDPTEAPAQGQAPKEEEEEEGFIGSVINLISDMFDMVEKAIDEIDKKSDHILKKLKEEVVAAVGHRLDPAVDRVRPYVVSLLKEMVEKHESFNPAMDEEFQKHLDLLDKYLPPYLHKVENYVSKL